MFERGTIRLERDLGSSLMSAQRPKWLNIGVGALVGLMLWFIWQAATSISPELQSILARFYISKLFFGANSAADTFFAQNGKDWTRTTHPAIFLPLSVVYCIIFSLLRPLPRITVWFFSSLLLGLTGIAFFESYRTIIPLGSPLVLIACSYVCGTLIFLESEKIARSRALAVDLQMQAEEERKRIASDLHDEVLPSLSRVMRLADKLQDQYGDGPIPQEIRERLESTVVEMRAVINDLHPAVLENFGLAASLQYLIDKIARETKIQAKFQDDSQGTNLPSFQSLCVYRIAQEALNNIEKHASASQMVLTLEKLQNSLCLKISDDGRGDLRVKPESHGLQNIKQRAKLIGGRVEWKTPDAFPTGTMLLLTVPLEASFEQKPKQVKETN